MPNDLPWTRDLFLCSSSPDRATPNHIWRGTLAYDPGTGITITLDDGHSSLVWTPLHPSPEGLITYLHHRIDVEAVS